MPNTYFKLTKAEFEKLRPVNNQVVIEIILPQLYETRDSGLIMVKDYSLFIANDPETAGKIDQSAPLDRIGKVAKIPEKLYFKKQIKGNPKSEENIKKSSAQEWKMNWETTVEIQPGDIVAHDYHSAHHCPILVVEDKQYRVLEYSNLIVAKRTKFNDRKGFIEDMLINGEGIVYEEEIIPLNGYCLFARVFKKPESNLIVDHLENVDRKRGIVRYCGSKVEYYDKTYYDDINIQPGDEVVFRDEIECLLENKSHFHMFDEELRYNQRKDVYGISEKV